MPLREYKCPECGKVVEQIEHYLEDAILPVCRHDDGPWGRVVSMVRVRFSKQGNPQFKGPGFYSTDYKEKL